MLVKQLTSMVCCALKIVKSRTLDWALRNLILQIGEIYHKVQII